MTLGKYLHYSGVVRVHVFKTQMGSGSNGRVMEHAGPREGGAPYAEVLTTRE